MTTLLEKAKAASVRNPKQRPTGDIEERLELAWAYLNGNVTGAQLCVAIDKSATHNASGTAYTFALKTIKEAIALGLVVRKQ